MLRLPLNSYEGNYTADPGRLEEAGRVVLRYCDAGGQVTDEANPNGSLANIAGVGNLRGNVAGLMPHPERAVEEVLGSTDGRTLLESFVGSLAPAHA